VKPIQSELPVIAQARIHGARLAAIDANGSATYRELLAASQRVASRLLAGEKDLNEARVAFLVVPGTAWVATLWGIWRAGGVAVPLALASTRPEIEYYVSDSGAATMLFDATTEEMAKPVAEALGMTAIAIEEIGDSEPVELPNVGLERRAMILFTSGTTNKPKGVVTTHANITAQITTLVEAWEWKADDRTLLCLPLHHVHGIINVTSCALWVGAVCEMRAKFWAEHVWERLESGELTVFMAVPTIYLRLISSWESATVVKRREMGEAAGKLRLMVSGSAALPVPVLERWKEISGQTLLERYGMTEIGMALSNPYRGERLPGCVGKPLPGVEVRLVSENGELLGEGVPGEIEVRGPSVFKEYWNRPEATAEAFREGWFRTGDTAVVEGGVYRILGRTSIDILKSGGHKLSALEIEEALLEHPAIAECAVVGIDDPEWGQRVAAAVVLRAGQTLDLEGMRCWARERIAPYKMPTALKVVDALPRNAMGKTVKAEVVKAFGVKC